MDLKIGTGCALPHLNNALELTTSRLLSKAAKWDPAVLCWGGDEPLLENLNPSRRGKIHRQFSINSPLRLREENPLRVYAATSVGATPA